MHLTWPSPPRSQGFYLLVRPTNWTARTPFLNNATKEKTGVSAGSRRNMHHCPQ